MKKEEILGTLARKTWGCCNSQPPIGSCGSSRGRPRAAGAPDASSQMPEQTTLAAIWGSSQGVSESQSHFSIQVALGAKEFGDLHTSKSLFLSSRGCCAVQSFNRALGLC